MAKNLKLVFAGVAGILAVIVALSCIFLAVDSYKEFSWQDNALSDLGSMDQQPTRSLFNYGLIAGGILALGFAYGLKKYLEEWKWAGLAAFAFGLDMLALISIGIFPGDFMPETHVHFTVSVAFFVLFPIAGFLITADFFKTNRKNLAWFTLALAAIAALVWIMHMTVYPLGSDDALPEIIAAFCAGAWVVTIGILMIKLGMQEGSAAINIMPGRTGAQFLDSIME